MNPRTPALVCVLVLAACSAPPAAPVPSPRTGAPSAAALVPPLDLGGDHVLLGFDGSDPLAASSGPTATAVRREGDAPLATTRSGDGTRGLRFPVYAPHDEGRLVLVLARASSTRAPSTRAASPTADLVFGADVELEGSGAGRQDDGDNVVQRGLYADPDQLKLQVDKGVPSCTVRTPRMRAFTALGHSLGAGWYRLSCHYDGVTLDLVATPFDQATGERARASTPAPAGALSFAASTLISVGGKVTSAGALVQTQPDQFNGVLDNVYVSSAG